MKGAELQATFGSQGAKPGAKAVTSRNRERSRPPGRRLAAALVAAFLACGGSSLPYFDDAGVYHAADGATVFTPGAACVGWDASHVNDPPAQCDGQDASECEVFLAEHSPPGSPIDHTDCDPNDAGKYPGTCTAAWTFESPNTIYPHCPGVGPAGDEFCTAWASQFFVHGERAPFSCIVVNDIDGLACWPGHGSLYPDYPCPMWPYSSGMYVEFVDGGSGCELPCTP